MRMEKIIIPLNAELIGHSPPQHTRGKWRRNYCLWDHIYSVAEQVERKDTIATAYRDGLSVGAKADEEMPCEDRALVVDRHMTDMRSEVWCHVPTGEVLDDD